ncbi:MAG: amino acid permease [Alphaproteobacteria bacterium]|nr:amino acid permease [Alphaproteobacteria bacterium]MDE2336299.1 amino acid permease [Alphaproteobacteria bacterium]
MSLMQQLTRKKFPSDLVTQNLTKCLTAWDLGLMGVGAIIGTGIFVLTGIAAATQAGPAVIVSFILSGIACGFAALSYAELSASVGGSGSAYGYSYAAFGEFIAWIIGWDLILEYAVSVEAVANGWAGYVKDALTAMGVGLPHEFTKGPLVLVHADGMTAAQKLLPANACSFTFLHDCYHATGDIMNLPAVLVILALMGLLVAGVKESVRFNAAMVFIKLLTIAVFICVALFHVDFANWKNFMPFGWYGVSADGETHGVLAGASMVFFAYVGFDAVSTAVGEAKNPRRDVPIGILGSLLFCTVIYIVVSGLLTLVVPYTALNVSSPVAHALQLAGVNWASALVATGVIIGLTTVMLVLYYGLTRILMSMAGDGLLPRFFSAVNGKTHTPVKNTVLCGIVMAAMAGVIPLDVLADLVNIGTLAAFVLVCAGVIVLRKTRPDMPRPFRMPFGPFLPLMGILSCGALIFFLPLITQLRFVVWLAVGLLIYFLYSGKNSSLAAEPR